MKRSASTQLTSRRYVKRPYRRALIPRSLLLPSSSTTFSNGIAAIPNTKTYNLVYDSILTPVTAIGQVLSLPVACNDPYDFDRAPGNAFGNKQPLYFDTLVSSSAYQQYKTVAWEITFTVINLAAGNALQVFAVPSSTSPTLFDTETKASNLPGVIKKCLTPLGGSNSHCNVTIKGNITDLYALYTGDSGFTGSSVTGPGSVNYGGLTLYATSGTVSAAVSVQAKLITQFSARTALIS